MTHSPPSVAVVAHGQPGDPGPQQARIEALARQVGQHLPGRTVLGATLACSASLSRLGSVTTVYPLFMAEGWFTRSELPRRLAAVGATQVQVLRPLGLDPALPAIGLRLAQRAAVTAGLVPAAATLVVVGHGSGKSRGSAQATQAFADAVAAADVFAGVTTAFIEEPPFLPDLRLSGPAVCLPFLATEAGHATGDIPDGWRAAGACGPIAPPVGCAPEVPALIARSIAAAVA